MPAKMEAEAMVGIPSVAEAKARWRSHTRHVLSDDAKKYARKILWKFKVSDGTPTCLCGPFVFEFHKSPQGEVYARYLGCLDDSGRSGV